jgi:hypothetical protein
MSLSSHRTRTSRLTLPLPATHPRIINAKHCRVRMQFAGISMSISWFTVVFHEFMDELPVNCGSGDRWEFAHPNSSLP